MNQIIVRAIAAAPLTVVALAAGDSPRYLLVAVAGSAHPCSSGSAPWRGHFLTEAGLVGGEAYCGIVAYGSEPFTTDAMGFTTAYQRGSFDYLAPMGMVPAAAGSGGQGGPGLLVATDDCPSSNGACASALAIAWPDAPPTILSSMETSVDVRDRSDTGWTVGFGALAGSYSWRVSPTGAFQSLQIGNGWGESVFGVNALGTAVGTAAINNQMQGVRWAADGTARVLAPAEAGAITRGLDIAIDGSVVGVSGDRAAWWPASAVASGAAASPLLPTGTQSVASHMVGNPSGQDPLGWAAFGTFANTTRLFRSNGTAWAELTLPTGIEISSVEVIDVPRHDLAVILGLTEIYQPFVLVWTPTLGVRKLNDFIVNPVDATPFGGMAPIDANSAGTMLVSLGFTGSPYLAVPLAMGDTNGDAVVDGVDLSALLTAWGPVTGGVRHAADFNGDALVGPADLALLLGAWGT